jgi:hypothetical protein
MPPKKGSKRKATAQTAVQTKTKAIAAIAVAAVTDDNETNNDSTREELTTKEEEEAVQRQTRTTLTDKSNATDADFDDSGEEGSADITNKAKVQKVSDDRDREETRDNREDAKEEEDRAVTDTTLTDVARDDHFDSTNKGQQKEVFEFSAKECKAYIAKVTMDLFMTKKNKKNDNEEEILNLLIKFPVKDQLKFLNEAAQTNENSDDILLTQLRKYACKVSEQKPAKDFSNMGQTESVANELKTLYERNDLRDDCLDNRVLTFLSKMKEDAALQAIEDLSKVPNLKSITNLSAYFKGVCSRRHDNSLNENNIVNGASAVEVGAASGKQSNFGASMLGVVGGAHNNLAFADVQNMLMRGVITPMIGTALERLFTANPSVQFDAQAWEEFTQLSEQMGLNVIDETFLALQTQQKYGGVRNHNGLFVSKIRKFLSQMRGVDNNHQGGGFGGGGGYNNSYGRGGYGGGGGGNFNDSNRGGRDQYQQQLGANNFNNGQSVDDQTLRSMLPDQASTRIIACIERGLFQRSTVDERFVQSLSRLDASQMDKVLNEMESCDVSNIHNVTGYFMGIIKKNRGGFNNHRGGAGNYGGSFNGGGY